jgi:hypothetical protein
VARRTIDDISLSNISLHPGVETCVHPIGVDPKRCHRDSFRGVSGLCRQITEALHVRFVLDDSSLRRMGYLLSTLSRTYDMSSMSYQILVENDTAVVSVSGALEQWSVAAMLAACKALPSHIMTLRIDLRALGTMTAEAMIAVRQALSAWRGSRAGCFQLSTSYLVATCRRIVKPADAPCREVSASF